MISRTQLWHFICAAILGLSQSQSYCCAKLTKMVYDCKFPGGALVKLGSALNASIYRNVSLQVINQHFNWLKRWPDDGTRWKGRGPPIWTWMSGPHFMAIHPPVKKTRVYWCLYKKNENPKIPNIVRIHRPYRLNPVNLSRYVANAWMFCRCPELLAASCQATGV